VFSTRSCVVRFLVLLTVYVVLVELFLHVLLFPEGACYDVQKVALKIVKLSVKSV
jgi:hypothetical protein